MAKQVWAVTAAADDQRIIVRQPNGDLRQVEMNTIRIDNTQLTNTDGQVKTYTIWADTAQSISRGTFQVVDWQDGAGNIIPDYQSATTYEIGETSVWTDWFVYRATTQTVGNDPKTGDTIHADWELINLWGIDITHNPASDYTVEDVILLNGKLYSPISNITASGAAPVAFVEGYGANQWYSISTGLFKYHLQADTYISDEIVRVENRLFQANNHTSWNTAFVEGWATDQFRPIGSSRDFQYPIHTEYIGTSGSASSGQSDSWTHTFTAGTIWCEVELQGAGWGRWRCGSNSGRGIASAWGWAYLKYRSNATLPASISGVVGRARTEAPWTSSSWTRGSAGWGSNMVAWNTASAFGWNGASTFWPNEIMQWGTGWGINIPSLTGFQLVESLTWNHGRNSYTHWSSSSTSIMFQQSGDGWDSKLGFGWTGATPINVLNWVGVHTTGSGYGYGAAAYSKWSGAGSQTTQLIGWQGIVRITEYFS